MKSRVLHPHAPAPGERISGKAGDILAFERRETTYPGWIWCPDDQGDQAWVPEAYVSIVGETCRLIRDYESRELEIGAGEVVRVLEAESGWAWVENEESVKGWVPLENLSLPDQEAGSSRQGPEGQVPECGERYVGECAIVQCPGQQAERLAHDEVGWPQIVRHSRQQLLVAPPEARHNEQHVGQTRSIDSFLHHSGSLSASLSPTIFTAAT